MWFHRIIMITVCIEKNRIPEINYDGNMMRHINARDFSEEIADGGIGKQPVIEVFHEPGEIFAGGDVLLHARLRFQFRSAFLRSGTKVLKHSQ